MEFGAVEVNNRDIIAAYLTTACIARSYRVESTRNTVDLWKELKLNIPLESNADLAATMLSLPMIIGTKDTETFDQTTYKSYHEQIEKTRIEMQESFPEDIDDAQIASAFIANASMSGVKGGDTRKKTIAHWKEVHESLSYEDPVDYLAAYLSPARIMDVREHPVDIYMIKDMQAGLKEELLKVLDDEAVESMKEVPSHGVLATCALAAAYIEISPKVERFRDIVNTWNELSHLAISPDAEYVIATVLMSGRIRDMDSMHLVQLGSLESQIATIVKLLRE